MNGDVDQNDFESPKKLNGNLTIKNNQAVLVVKIKQDSLQEPIETMFFDLFDSGGDYVARTKVLINNRLTPVLTPEPEDPVESPPGQPVPNDEDGGNIGVATDAGGNLGPIVPGINIGAGITVGLGTGTVGIITDVAIDRPGFGYTGGDTVQFGGDGGCIYKLIVTETGAVVGVESGSGCTSIYDENPGEGVITSSTGQAARLFPVLQFTPQFKKITVVNQLGVISVVDCV